MKNTSNQTAEAWLAATLSGKWEDTETFARLLFEECRVRVPFGSGIMQGTEREVIQETCLMLFGSFLLQNKRLQAATAAGDLVGIDVHLRASVQKCIRFSIQRIARASSRELSRRMEEPKEQDFGSVDHPWDRSETDLSVDERCAMALAALQLALEHQMLSKRASEIARLTLEAGLAGEEIAARLGISPSAVSQQLKKVSAQLNGLKDAVEVAVK